jgi:hypothetical protein
MALDEEQQRDEAAANDDSLADAADGTGGIDDEPTQDNDEAGFDAEPELKQ